MRTLHLFAGIGGGLLADLILGHKPIAAVEWDSYACAVLRERAADGWFPGLRVHECDVRMFDPSEYAGEVDCIHAGFPCQDISLAGRQAGLGEGTRSGLYREILRIAGVVRPRYLFLENVSAILSGGLGTVLGDLAGMGYDTRWCCIRASDVGAPHQRDRWWLLGTMVDTECLRGSEQPEFDVQRRRKDKAEQVGLGCSDVAHPNSLRELQPEGCEQDQRGRISDCGKNLADATSAGQQDSEGGGAKRERTWNGTSDNASGGIGEEKRWSPEPAVGRVANGIPNAMDRVKGLGNAQVPLQAAAAFVMLFGESTNA